MRHGFNNLLAIIAERSVAESKVVPMEVLFKDEKYIAQKIDILPQLMRMLILVNRLR